MSPKKVTRVALALMAVVALAACTKKPEPAPTAKGAALPQEVADLAPKTEQAAEKVERQDDAAGLEENGKIVTTGELASPEESALAAHIPGIVARLEADRGDRVKAGQPLLTFDTSYLDLDLERAKAERARAQAALDQAELELQRKEQLRQRDSIPQAVLDGTRAARDQAKAARDAAEVAVETAAQRQADGVLRSPFDGVVVERRTAAGEHLGDNSVAFVVARTTPLELHADLPEKWIARIHTGMAITATVDPFPGASFAGTISAVGRTVDSKTRTFFVEARIPNPDGRLLPGLFARVEIPLD